MNENVTRSLSGLVYITVLIFATLFSRESFLLLFGLFLLQTVSEFSNLMLLPKLPALVLASLMYLVFGCLETLSDFTNVGLLLASLFIGVKLLLWLFAKNNNIVAFQSKWVSLIGYVILPFIFIIKISNVFGDFCPKLIIVIFVLIWTNDTFAYIVGKSFGKNKLFEAISPKKTIEGFVGGLVFAMVAGLVISYKELVPNTGFVFWIVTATIVSVFGTLGDLVESKFKRIAQVKDSGNIMPGHGGLLDRLDSIIFVSPFLFLFYKILVYVS